MKQNKGITIMALVVTVVVLLILAGISIEKGTNVITRSQLENIKTDMMLVQVKGKEYVENANFELGTGYDKLTDESEKTKRLETAKSKLKGTEITDAMNLDSNLGITAENFQTDNDNLIFYYELSNQDLADIGISDVKSDEKNGKYIVKYDLKNVDVEVYNTKGFANGDKSYYSLNEIENLNV